MEESNFKGGKIAGVNFKPLKTFADDRGFFREILRVNDPGFAEGFGQLSHSKMVRNTLKAWHFHHRQIDWWYVAHGVLECALFDNRPASPTQGTLSQFKLGDPEIAPDVMCALVRIPPGVLHGCKVVTDEAVMFYVTSRTYDPKDEGRIPFDSPGMPIIWGDAKGLVVADNDRKTFIPPYELMPLGGD